MRRLLVLVLLTPLLLVASPANSEPIVRYPIHGFNEYWSLRSYDCTGAEMTGTDFALDRVGGGPIGIGALQVNAPDTVGGVLKMGTKFLPTYNVRLRPTSGTAPTMVWRVEINGHTLISDPVALTPDEWQVHALRNATLREGEWSGTIQQAINEFGPAEAWWAGALTGGCLGSETADVDQYAYGWGEYDLEPSRWVELDHPGGYGTAVKHGKRFRLNARVMRTVLETGVDHPIRRAHVTLQRKLDGQHRWTVVDEARTGKNGTIAFRQTAPRKDATYRAVWRGPDGKIAGTDPANVEVY